MAAVSGTSKQHVAYDYARRISRGYGDGMGVTNGALEYLIGKTSSPFSQCPDANVSICAASETLPLVVVAYNPLAQAVHSVLRIPVSTSAVSVIDANNTVVPSQVTAAAEFDTGTWTAASKLGGYASEGRVFSTKMDGVGGSGS